MHNYLKHTLVFLSFIIFYIFCKLYIPQFNFLATIIIAVLIAHYITRYVISENWIAKVVRFILGKYF
jgi:multisubunit Na+/H+ antiporter MnhE subunit